MAEAVVSFVLESLGNLLFEEAKLLHGVGGKVEQLCDDLRMMQAFLKDADARQNEDERIRVWVSKIRSLAYDAGDVLESYILGVESRKKGGFKNILKRYVCIVDECIVNHKVSSKIDDIRTAITDLSTGLQAYGIRSLPEVREGSSSTDEIRGQLRRSYSHVDEDDFIALEGEVENLVNLLVNDEDGDKYYRVVSIYGMGGLGKTTIAKKVYKHARVKSHFAAFAWVCISRQWQKRDILQKILKNLTPEDREQIPKLDDEELIKKIFEVQQSRKCLVVLDDMWLVDDWDRLKPAFPIGNKRSKLLLTSRNVDVVTHADPKGFHYQPRVLVDDECLELLWKKAFNGRVPDGKLNRTPHFFSFKWKFLFFFSYR
ncbi:hypothetical protein LguiB_014104 [Lonicera macranthoides]